VGELIDKVAVNKTKNRTLEIALLVSPQFMTFARLRIRSAGI